MIIWPPVNGIIIRVFFAQLGIGISIFSNFRTTKVMKTELERYKGADNKSGAYSD